MRLRRSMSRKLDAVHLQCRLSGRVRRLGVFLRRGLLVLQPSLPMIGGRNLEGLRVAISTALVSIVSAYGNAEEIAFLLVPEELFERVLDEVEPLSKALPIGEILLYHEGDDWPRRIAWAVRSRLKPFVRAARTIRQHLAGIHAYLRTRATNALVEGLNNKLRMIARRAYGFHSPDALIAMLFLTCGGIELCPPLPHPMLRRGRLWPWADQTMSAPSCRGLLGQAPS